MADVVNRTTKQYLQSVNTPDYPTADWIVNPDLTLVEGWPNKYWVIVGDLVTLADPATRASIDSAEESARRDAVADQVDELQTMMRAFVQVLLDERNADAVRFNAIRDAVGNANNLNEAKTAMQAIPDAPTRTLAQIKTELRSKLDG